MKEKITTPVYTRIDERATFTMLIVAVLGLMSMAYQYTRYQPCTDFKIITHARQYHAGEPVRLETDRRTQDQLHWNFGDNEHDDTKVNSAVHAYDEPGEYTVSVTINGTCTEYTTVLIIPAPRIENPALQPNFLCPGSAVVGKPVRFTDSTKDVFRWEWRFGETGSVDATSRSASYTFTTPGLKTVSLMLNDNPVQLGVCKIYVDPAPEPERKNAVRSKKTGGAQRMIVVKEKPESDPLNEQMREEKPEPVITAPEVTVNDFHTQLRAVANKYYGMEHFMKYTCGKNVGVTLNGQETDFATLCNKLGELKSDKKIKKLSVHLIKNETTRCVIGMIVTLKEKEGLLKKIF